MYFFWYEIFCREVIFNSVAWMAKKSNSIPMHLVSQPNAFYIFCTRLFVEENFIQHALDELHYWPSMDPFWWIIQYWRCSLQQHSQIEKFWEPQPQNPRVLFEHESSACWYDFKLLTEVANHVRSLHQKAYIGKTWDSETSIDFSLFQLNFIHLLNKLFIHHLLLKNSGQILIQWLLVTL